MTIMTGCTTSPLVSAKACSGKCKGGGCAPHHVWVLAACEGKAALFHKEMDGRLRPLIHEGRCVSSFADGLGARLTHAYAHTEFNQLVLVGGANDIAWTQASLPAAVSQHVVAEIEYPLMATWFGAVNGLARLTQALEHVFHA